MSCVPFSWLKDLEAIVPDQKPVAKTEYSADPAKVDQYAAMAQAEGVGLPVAQRLLKNLQGQTRLR